MDQRLPYEQIIAGKLESLPIPDMQDMIWARIKADLDADMPDNDGGTDPNPPAGPGVVGWGLSILVIALITVFFLLKDKLLPTAPSDITLPNETMVQPDVSTNDPPADPVDALPWTNNKERPTVPAVESQDLPVSTAVPQPLDSISGSNRAPDIAVQPPADTIPKLSTQEPKRSRGVSGITNDDYRIVPRDTTKKQ